MTASHIIELVGYIGSALILVSMLMTSVFRLRVINMTGSAIFTIYALIIHSYPTALMNICLVIINLRFLWKMSHHENDFELVEVKNDDAFLLYGLNKYGEDIRKCFPHIDIRPEEADACYLTCTEGTPVGFFLGRTIHPEDVSEAAEARSEGGHAESLPGIAKASPASTGRELEILLDYSTPGYRDFSLGTFLMRKLKEAGIKQLVYRGPDEHHHAYLDKMGFRKIGDAYQKEL